MSLELTAQKLGFKMAEWLHIELHFTSNSTKHQLIANLSSETKRDFSFQQRNIIGRH